MRAPPIPAERIRLNLKGEHQGDELEVRGPGGWTATLRGTTNVVAFLAGLVAGILLGLEMARWN